MLARASILAGSGLFAKMRLMILSLPVADPVSSLPFESPKSGKKIRQIAAATND
jgi:hypothetical protein